MKDKLINLDKIQEEVSRITKDLKGISLSFADTKDLILQQVEDIRIRFLGKKGSITALLDSLKLLDKDQRPQAGKIINSLKQEAERIIEELKAKAIEAKIIEKTTTQNIDITLPVEDKVNIGSLHPISLMKQELCDVFRKMGFTIYDGPEVDLDYYNFECLNFQTDHPARDMQDTFFIKEDVTGNKTHLNLLLRTHTSNIQIHSMLNEKPPLRIVAPGRTFRCDSDLTHTPMFYQLEAFVVDYHISLADMKGVIDAFIKEVFGHDSKIRLRPSYFPFVEPGGEVDMVCVICKGKGCKVCKNSGWVEIGGCGMIHPNVFESVGYDSERYTGFAFGFGIDRMVMLKYSLKDSRLFYEAQRSFLSQFPVIL